MSDRRALVGGSRELESRRSEWWLGQGRGVLGGGRKGSGFYPECNGVNRAPWSCRGSWRATVGEGQERG